MGEPGTGEYPPKPQPTAEKLPEERPQKPEEREKPKIDRPTIEKIADRIKKL